MTKRRWKVCKLAVVGGRAEPVVRAAAHLVNHVAVEVLVDLVDQLVVSHVVAHANLDVVVAAVEVLVAALDHLDALFVVVLVGLVIAHANLDVAVIVAVHPASQPLVNHVALPAVAAAGVHVGLVNPAVVPVVAHANPDAATGVPVVLVDLVVLPAGLVNLAVVAAAHPDAAVNP